jgi:hypothetical protein
MYGGMAQAPPTSWGDIVMPLSLQSMNNGMGQVPFNSNWIWVEVHNGVRACFLVVDYKYMELDTCKSPHINDHLATYMRNNIWNMNVNG